MLLYVKDGAGVGRYEVVEGQEDATIADRSGTITTGGAAQALMAANPSTDSAIGRSGWWIQNEFSGALSLNILGGSAAAGTGVVVGPGQTAGTIDGVDVRVPLTTAAISVFGTTTGAAFSALEW